MVLEEMCLTLLSAIKINSSNIRKHTTRHTYSKQNSQTLFSFVFLYAAFDLLLAHAFLLLFIHFVGLPCVIGLRTTRHKVSGTNSMLR